MIVEAGAVLLAGGRGQFHHRVINVVLAPQFREFAEDNVLRLGRCLRDDRRFAARGRGVLFYEELVAFRLSHLLGDGTFTPAGRELLSRSRRLCSDRCRLLHY